MVRVARQAYRARPSLGRADSEGEDFRDVPHATGADLGEITRQIDRYFIDRETRGHI